MIGRIIHPTKIFDLSRFALTPNSDINAKFEILMNMLIRWDSITHVDMGAERMAKELHLIVGKMMTSHILCKKGELVAVRLSALSELKRCGDFYLFFFLFYLS
jgi:hypothetical protein